jgi:anhydro-N-acetylmuramic acid kinase
MQKKYLSLGLMSGTSGDGVDASLIYSDGINQLEVVKDKYFEYETSIYQSIHSMKEKIFNINHLKQYSNQLLDLERKITIFHSKIINDFKIKNEDLLIGFHGQTIFHSPENKISKQLGNGQLLNQLTKKKIIFNFRKNDILNGGEGAPLTPIFHQLLATQKNFLLPACFLNIGGISNVTIVNKSIGSSELFSKDIGPGNCLIDNWMRKNTNKKFDNEGKLASLGKKNQIILEQAQELYTNRINKEKSSLDVNDFDISFARGLSVEDGVATLTDFTASIIGEEISTAIVKSGYEVKDVLICGGGRKNNVLIKKIKENTSFNLNLKLIDSFGINGDFVESQAFAFLAIRSILNLPISFPSTTGCIKPCSGGELIKN